MVEKNKDKRIHGIRSSLQGLFALMKVEVSAHIRRRAWLGKRENKARSYSIPTSLFSEEFSAGWHDIYTGLQRENINFPPNQFRKHCPYHAPYFEYIQRGGT